MDSDLIDVLKAFARRQKVKGYSQETQAIGMKAIFDSILYEVYSE